MKEHIIISLVFLLQVILDASGDAFRLRGKQVIHHIIEALQVAIWIMLLALMGIALLNWEWYYIAMYILGRFILFDVVFNLIAGNPWWYVGKSSLYGRFMHWIFPGTPLAHKIFMPKLMALVWWVAWLLTDGGIRYL